jgi:hypothetical protein
MKMVESRHSLFSGLLIIGIFAISGLIVISSLNNTLGNFIGGGMMVLGFIIAIVKDIVIRKKK